MVDAQVLEGILRQTHVLEDAIMEVCCHPELDRDLFIALDSSEEGLRDTGKEAFWIDRLLDFFSTQTWHAGKVQSEAKQRADAVAYLAADWEALMTGFKKQ